jgi:hypothetical protein
MAIMRWQLHLSGRGNAWSVRWWKKKATCDIAALVSSGMCRGPLLCWDLQ